MLFEAFVAQERSASSMRIAADAAGEKAHVEDETQETAHNLVGVEMKIQKKQALSMKLKKKLDSANTKVALFKK